MLRYDARSQHLDPDSVLGNNDMESNLILSEIEKELQNDTYDMISLVFLLYDVPDTALQRLTVLQRTSKEVDYSTNLNLLYEWFQYAKVKPCWKNEFIEALLVCQLYGIIRKLGLDIQATKEEYEPHKMNTKKIINPLKKSLYKLCENINSDNLLNLKRALFSYQIDNMHHESCELVLLDLMCRKFITINQPQYGAPIKLDPLINIIKNLPGLNEIARELGQLQEELNDKSKPSTSTINNDQYSLEINIAPSIQTSNDNAFNLDDLQEVFERMDIMDIEENESFKCDRQISNDSCYEIYNPNRIGVCVIINQVSFYPSKYSIEHNQSAPLGQRMGSEKDKENLNKTMSSLKFEVIDATDLDHKEMFTFIKNILRNKVRVEDSMFMLCILSHGVRGHVFAADSVKVKVDDIQNLLESDDAVKLSNKPKLMVIQACQVNEEPSNNFVADSPHFSNQKKANFLIYWATAPELNAYRHEVKGSVFIQLLCTMIATYGKKDHLSDIFTKVSDYVIEICKRNNCPQVPLYQSTLRKKLYLQIPC